MKKVLDDIKLDFSDVLILPKESYLTSRKKIDLNISYKFKYSNQIYKGIPIIASNMVGIGTIKMAEVLSYYNIDVALHKHYSINEELINHLNNYSNTWYTIGINDNDIEKLIYLSNNVNITKICIDVANGYMNKFINTISYIREKFQNSIIMTGNVVTPDQTIKCINAGADIVKIGIGSGSFCLTRRITGIGFPQFSAILECTAAADSVNGMVCSDGGIIYPGDVSKAFGGGANFVMIGSMFAGHDESEQELIDNNIIAYGMSSETAQNNHNNGLDNYKTSEGRTVKLQNRGSIKNTIENILGGIRSTCTYTGSKILTDLENNCQFIKVNRQLSTQYENITISN